MRKCLVFVCFLVLLSSFAQNNGQKLDDYNYEFTFNGTSDQFAEIGWAPGCDGDNSVKAISSDGSVAGELSVTVDGEQTYWQHVELNLVDASGLSSVSVDMSNEMSTVEVTFSATTAGEVMLLLTDKTTVDPVYSKQEAASNTAAIRTSYSPSEGIIDVTNNSDSIPENDWDNGGLDWRVFPWTPGLVGVNVDSTQISEIWVYYRRDDFTSTICSNDDLISGQISGVLTLKSIKLRGGEVTGDVELESKSKVGYFPNPASDVIYFENLEPSVILRTLGGKVVISDDDVRSINVANIESGLYLLETENGVSKVLVE